MSLGRGRVQQTSATAIRRRVSKYQDIIDAVNQLMPGECLVVPVSKDDDAQAARNRLNTAIRPKLKALRGLSRFIFRVSEKDEVVIEYGRSA